MELIIIGHPRRRMGLRQITEEDIINAIANFVSSWASPKGGIQYIGPALDGRLLKIWVLDPGFVDPDCTITIKSVAWKDEEDPQ